MLIILTKAKLRQIIFIEVKSQEIKGFKPTKTLNCFQIKSKLDQTKINSY